MPASIDRSATSIAAYYQQLISKAMPFAQSESGDLFLLSPFPDVPTATQREALSHLVSLGALSDYRYIDAEPQAAILAIRA
jgi:hypothetical protein